MLDDDRKNLCDTCSTSREDGTCSISYLKGVPKHRFKTCSCNPNKYFFRKPVLDNDRCNDGAGCPDQGDGSGEGTCHMSYPWYDKLKFKSLESAPRCKYPLDSDDPEDSDDPVDSD